ncbi:hypothetical protein [Nocardia stercoris]|uniref:hypothetical protein n=1 Tax=Nocardia stercoris TaxID=2483361 RepID=UPI0011C38F2D|nr:hypothetical protein [Nocardia stercoris]
MSSPVPQTPAATHVEAEGESVATPRIRRRTPLFVAGALPVAALLVAGPPGAPQPMAAAHPVVTDDLGAETPAGMPDTTVAEQDQPGAEVIDPGAADSYTAPDWNFEQSPAAGTDEETPAVDDQQAPADDIAEEFPAPDAAAAPGVDPAAAADTAPAGPAPRVLVARNSPVGARAIPGQRLAPVEVDKLHLPNLAALPTVAPIQAPDGVLRFGDLESGYRPLLPDDAAAQINDAAAHSEAQFASTLDAAGFDPTRSDRIAASTMAGGAIGTSIANTVASPLTSASLAVGAVAGFIAGIPFLPGGLVVLPVVGAAMGAAAVAIPVAMVGASVGALVGAAAGLAAPAVDAPDDVMPSVDDAPLG